MTGEGVLSCEGRRVLVLGLGVTGCAVARVLARRGARVLASDCGAVPEDVVRTLEALGVEIETQSHQRAQAAFRSVDFVVPSPGVSPRRGLLAEIVASGTRVVSELDVAQELTRAPVLAVTGTNGKTTVVRLAERIAREAGLAAFACGNTETPFVLAADEHPDADLFVVECSSFRLAFAETFHPRVAVITNLAPDHLDWHLSFEHYRAAKARMARRQGPGDLFLYPEDQPELANLAPEPGPRRVAFGPATLVVPPEALDRLAQRGGHFVSDAAAAAAATALFGAEPVHIERALTGFDPDPHRLELVGSRRGVLVYDDAVSANVHATLAALRRFDVPVVLICGGRNKALDLRPLAWEAGRLRHAVVLGEAADDLASVLTGAGVFVSKAGSLSEAVEVAFEHAETGDVVLLSPACASHDMFANYAERGRAFREVCYRLGVRP